MMQNLITAAPLGTFIIAVISAAFAFWAIKMQRRNVKEQVARNLFAEYIKKSIDFPHFASPEISVLKTESKMNLKSIHFISIEEFQQNHPEIEQYEWFISLLVFSLNEILSLKPNKKREAYWNKLALRHLGYHRSYFLWRISVEKIKGTEEIWFLQLSGEFCAVMEQLLSSSIS